MMGIYKSTDDQAQKHPNLKYSVRPIGDDSYVLVFGEDKKPLNSPDINIIGFGYDKETADRLLKKINESGNIVVDTVMLIQSENKQLAIMNGTRVKILEILRGCIRILPEGSDIQRIVFKCDLVPVNAKLPEADYFYNFSA